VNHATVEAVAVVLTLTQVSSNVTPYLLVVTNVLEEDNNNNNNNNNNI
jgi:hypothetical protein